MTKAEEKKLNEAAERVIEKMQIKDCEKWEESYIGAYWIYGNHRETRIATLEAYPEYETTSWKRISEYNRRDLREFVKFLIKIRREETIKLIFWKKKKENE